MANLAIIQQNQAKLLLKRESDKLDSVKKLTHLYLHDKYLKKIGNFTTCVNLQVLYLHNNEIDKIENLAPLRTLKHLYLQFNKINKIEGLGNLRQLRKLYLGKNEISVVEGLENVLSLEELHIEKQKLRNGESLCFDPRSLIQLAEHLQILNISNNNLISIKDLKPMKFLKILNASFNKISDINDVTHVVQSWYYLIELNLIGNPIAKQHRYRETIIANTFRLVVLDGKDINETTRDFIKKFEYEKSQCKPPTDKALDKILDIPNAIAPPAVKKIVSKNITKNVLKKNLSNSILMTSLSEEEMGYIPWQALRPNTENSKRYIPPLFTKQKTKSQSAKKVHFSTVFPNI